MRKKISLATIFCVVVLVGMFGIYVRATVAKYQNVCTRLDGFPGLLRSVHIIKPAAIPCAVTGTGACLNHGACSVDLPGGGTASGTCTTTGPNTCVCQLPPATPTPTPNLATSIAPPSGLIAWWAGDGDTRDLSGNGLDGTLFNNAGYAIGYVGQSFDCRAGTTSSPTHMRVADNATLKPAQFTLEVWVKFTPTFDNYSVAIAKGFATGVNDSYALGTAPQVANPQFFTTHNGSSHALVSPSNLSNPNSWNHLAASYDGSTKKLYVNGSLVASVFIGQPIQYDANPAPLTIGADWENGIPQYLFSGMIDEPTIYNRALTDAEILSIYNAGVGGKIKSAATTSGTAAQTRVNDATVTFENVTASGTTTDNSIDPSAAGSLPGGYTQTGLAYDISTTATFSGTANLCFHIPSINDATAFSQLKVLHSEGGGLVDKTTGFNLTSRLVCGAVTSLSPFVIANGLSPSATSGLVDGTILDASGNPLSGVAIQMNGTQNRLTVTNNQGSYAFADVETNGFYTITPARADYAFTPSQRSFSQLGQHTEATFSGFSTGNRINPIDLAEFFVRQQYVDLLSREPDEGGFAYWTDRINKCGGDPSCIRSRRVDVSNAFFVEQEYQQTGAYVFRLYRAAFGNNQPNPNRNVDPAFANEERTLPSYASFARDSSQIRGGSHLAQLQLDLANQFVSRAVFVERFPAFETAAQYIDAVLATIANDSGADLSAQRESLIGLFKNAGGGSAGQAVVLYRLANDDVQMGNAGIDNRPFVDAEYNRAFVYTQYAGYLRRDADPGGFLFWLNQVNNSPLRNRNTQHAMVCSFITSDEYQKHFSFLATHSNQECPN